MVEETKIERMALKRIKAQLSFYQHEEIDEINLDGVPLRRISNPVRKELGIILLVYSGIYIKRNK